MYKNGAVGTKAPNPLKTGALLDFLPYAYMLGRNLTVGRLCGIINCMQKGLKGVFCPIAQRRCQKRARC